MRLSPCPGSSRHAVCATQLRCPSSACRMRHQPASPLLRYVLYAAEEQGFELPYACRLGCCTACTVKVKEGQMFQPHSLGLSKSLRDQVRAGGGQAAGMCVSAARGLKWLSHGVLCAGLPHRSGPAVLNLCASAWLPAGLCAHVRGLPVEVRLVPPQLACLLKLCIPAWLPAGCLSPASEVWLHATAACPPSVPGCSDLVLETVPEDEAYELQFGRAFAELAVDPNAPSVERDDYALELAMLDE